MVRVCVLLLCAVTLWALCPESSAHPAPTGIEVNSGSRDKRNPDAGTEVNAARRDKRSPARTKGAPLYPNPNPRPTLGALRPKGAPWKRTGQPGGLREPDPRIPKGKGKTLPPGGR
ncbi:uncharacterized protein LOC117648377 [Thrips palmi]|uniref:Uncharacterized protein LOC117648377 n=1 Tax=Thrips palmi TaxID=161013 RepID=A0A6P8ZR08_THRPL|nr:uncharacterized protein LOC117648377 [Thrips palmi]